jgi:hypothetical protein
MLTYTQSYKRAADMTGISITQNSVALDNIKQDINQGIRIFKNAARRYWTRKEIKTNLVQNQQYYTFPEDVVRLTTAKIVTGQLELPLIMVDSEEVWNRLNIIPAMTVGIPTYGYIRGRNELGLYPRPSQNVTNGLIISYESRLRDMNIEDVTTTISVTNGQNTIGVPSGTPFNANMVGSWLTVTDGSDGNWYQITGFTDSSHITIENDYQGPTKSSVAALIGEAADIPEDFHLGPVYYAAYNYFLKRKDKDTAAAFKSLYDDLRKQYIEVYAAKTTGATQNDITAYSHNMFGLPPGQITG